MAKVIDITDKLASGESPRLRIRGVELEINDDAETVIRLMGMVADGISNEDVLKVVELLFPEESRRQMAAMKLKYQDYMTAVTAAMNLAVGADEDDMGEDGTHTTT